MKATNKNLMTLEEFKENNYGKRGTKDRDELEAGYKTFEIGALVHDTCVEMGMSLKYYRDLKNSLDTAKEEGKIEVARKALLKACFASVG